METKDDKTDKRSVWHRLGSQPMANVLLGVQIGKSSIRDATQRPLSMVFGDPGARMGIAHWG